MKFHDYVQVTSWFYEWYNWYIVERSVGLLYDNYKVNITHNVWKYFEDFTSWWIKEYDLKIIK